MSGPAGGPSGQVQEAEDEPGIVLACPACGGSRRVEARGLHCPRCNGWAAGPVALTPSGMRWAAMLAEVVSVARTLRWVAGGIDDDLAHPEQRSWAEHYRDVADVLERLGLEALEDCCPACQEVVCDEDCPLAGVREGL